MILYRHGTIANNDRGHGAMLVARTRSPPHDNKRRLQDAASETPTCWDVVEHLPPRRGV
jgi:hypothetical protein